MSQTERVHHTELDADRIELLFPQLVRHTEQQTLQSSVLEELQGVVRNVNRFRSPEQRLGVLLHAFLQHIPGARQGAIYLSTASDYTFITGAISPSRPDLIGTEVDVRGGYIEAVAQVKFPVLLPDTQQEALTRQSATSESATHVLSALVVPFIVGGRTVGVLSLENCEQTCAFVQGDLDFAALLSEHTAMTVDNARLLLMQPQDGDWQLPELSVIQTLSESISLGILIVNQSQGRVWGNSTFCDMTGYAQDELGSSLHRIHRTLAGPEQPEPRESAPVSHRWSRPRELTLTRRDKTPCPTRATVLSFGAIGIRYAKGYIGVFEDVGERTVLERELLHMQRLSSVGTLMSGAAHELNNPLTAVIGFAELVLARDDMPSDSRTDLRTIVKQAERSIRVTRELLDYLHLSVSEPIQLEVNYIVSQLVRFRMYMIENDSIGITLDLTECEPRVFGDARQIQQVLLNLINNAEQACASIGRPCEIEISTSTVREGELVRISVRDNGPGIAQEIQSRVFDPFFTTRPAGEATGLGLTICQQIISRHGGKIWFESEPGQGTTFLIDLPAARTSDVSTESDPVMPSPQGTVPSARILVVDDEQSINKLLTRVLTRTGHRVDAACDGREALSKLRENIYDIVFLDLKIPILSGQAVYAWIKRNQSDLLQRTVILTGDTLNSETIGFLEQEHAVRLLKPFQLIELRHLMDRLWPG